MTVATLIREIEQAKIQPEELLRALGQAERDEDYHLSPFGDWRARAALAELNYVGDRIGRKFARELAKHLKVPLAGGGGLTQSYNECFYASIAAGTALATFTTEDNLQKTLPHVIIPAGFFSQVNMPRSLSFLARGRLGTTGTPTYTFTFRIINSTTWSAGGIGIATAAITAGSGVTAAPWRIAVDVVARTVGAGGGSNTTLAMLGELIAGTALAAGGGVYSMPGANVAFTGSLDAAATQYVYFSVACGASNASNTVTLEMLKAFAEN